MSATALDEQLQRLADVLDDAVVFTQDDQVVGCNQRACELFGYGAGELIGQHRSALLVPGDARTASGVEVRRTTGWFSGAITFVKKGGARFEASATSVVLVGADGAEVLCGVIHGLDRRRADEATGALQESNELLHALTDAAFEAILVHRDGVILTANRAAELTAGVGRGELQGRKLFDFIAPESIPTVLARVAALDESPYSAFGRRADGTIYPVEVQARTGPVNVNGSPARVVALRDISARVSLEEQFRQAQKMEAVGRLAGGVAHDFNNLLSVILSGAALAAEGLAEGHPSREDLAEVVQAAERAAGLTRQLLAFSRKQVLQPQVVDVDEVLGRMESMIRRLIGEDIELVVVKGSGGRCIKADPGQLENMLMNLVVNARDAMSATGGRLTLASAFMVADEAWAREHLDTRAGPQVGLSITDTGAGMDAGTRARIFEPFFTTKGAGRGTGLGLSTVFGIVKQAGGTIWVESEPGRGATFRAWFPETSEASPAVPADSPARVPVPRGKTVLVVEDEPQLCKVVATVLRQSGFEVLATASGPEALARCADHAGAIDLLLTDMVMPGLNGKQVADAVRAQRPSVRVLYMSGYTDHGIVTEGVVDSGVNFLPKPITPQSLLAKVLEVLR